MKKPYFFNPLLVVIFIFLFSQCHEKTENTYRYELQFLTEEYKPFNYTENSALTGLAPEILEKICSNLAIQYNVEVLPWNEAYGQAQNSDNAVLFSTALNADRKDLFKWAGPIAKLEWLFYSTVQNQDVLNSLDDAKKVAEIGVIKDYAIEQYLLNKGFTNLVECTSQVDGFDRLLKGEIDLFPSDNITAEAALQELGKTIYSVSNKMIIMTDMVYFAFNKNIPDDVVADFQYEIDRLKNDGTLKTLTQKYLSTSDYPETIQIYTEQYPPLTFRNSSGQITGFGSDIVYEIMKRNGQFFDITLSSWSNGYELALNNPNVCLFTMDRTEIRENLFQWVGPIGTNTTWFYTKAGSGITINSIDDAKNLVSVGTVDSWFSNQYLVELGFSNLVANSDPAVMAQKLIAGEIDAFVCTGVTYPDILKSIGYDYSEVDPSYSLMSSDYYIAFSKNTSQVIVGQWQSALDAIKSDDTYSAIVNKWLK